jgi:hypothetical protein
MRAWISLTRDGQDVACGLAAELVGAVAGADGDRQRVQLGGLDEHGSFFGVGQHLAVVQLAFGADAVFLAGFAGFQVAQAAQLAFHGGADLVAMATTFWVTSTL